jgi:hypothetical protein
MTESLGAKGSGLLDRDCGFTNSRPSSAPCAGRAIAMLIIPIQGEAGCDRYLQRNLAQRRRNPGQKI